MDLYNNNAGRQMALDPSNRDGRAEEVIREVLREGRAAPAARSEFGVLSASFFRLTDVGI